MAPPPSQASEDALNAVCRPILNRLETLCGLGLRSQMSIPSSPIDAQVLEGRLSIQEAVKKFKVGERGLQKRVAGSKRRFSELTGQSFDVAAAALRGTPPPKRAAANSSTAPDAPLKKYQRHAPHRSKAVRESAPALDSSNSVDGVRVFRRNSAMVSKCDHVRRANWKKHNEAAMMYAMRTLRGTLRQRA